MLRKMKKMRYQHNKKKKWFEARQNQYIYVTGLPKDVTHEKLVDYFRKCGAIKLDSNTGEESVKIYMDEDGQPKGDARIGFAKEESVSLAIEMMDNSFFCQDHKIIVTEAVFK